MKFLKRFLPLLLVTIAALSLGSFALAAKIGEASITFGNVARETADAFVTREIGSIIEEDTPGCIWTGETTWSSVVPLYDCYDNCNGFVYRLETGGKKTGYIQINQLNGELRVYCFSFTGISAIDGLAEDTEEQVRSSFGQKLYFFGNMTYCVKTGENTYEAIDSCESISRQTVEDYYTGNLTAYTAQRKQASVMSLSGHVFSTRAADYTLSTMSDFGSMYAYRPNGIGQRVVNHCSPTAATNIMRYFRVAGTSPLSASMSDSELFIHLYYAMDTNGISTSNEVATYGTNWDHIESGISAFCTDYGCSPQAIGTVASVTLRKIQGQLNSGRLLQMELVDFPSQGSNHSVVAFDYSGNRLYISTGWDRDYHYYPFDDISVAQYVYVGY